jgi:GT2 family glycosyltransferase
MYTIWGLPYPRGRDGAVESLPTKPELIFAGTGGASLFRMKMLDEIGLFDEDFFAYYEDVDLGFRAQLAGWKVALVPAARAYHKQGATSNKIKGFTTYQTLKNLPLLALKNVPFGLLWKVWPRLMLAHGLFTLRALSRGHVGPALKANLMWIGLIPKILKKRHVIQKTRKLTTPEVEKLLDHNLPPNAAFLRRLFGTGRQS